MDDKVNILIVDDRPDKLLALEAVLAGLGENVVRAGSGREALLRLLKQDFAVILLDVNMPDMDGFETASLIRQRQRCARTPIIFVTAFSDDLHAARGYSLGAVDYILSPVVPEVLCTKVAVFVEFFKKTEEVKRHAEQQIALEREQAARAAAEEANRRKDEFLAMLSHELRNPLAPIFNALHILRLAGPDDPSRGEAQNLIERQVRQLAGIVDGLLDTFRITHGKITLRPESLDLTQLVSEIVADHRRAVEGHGLTLTLERVAGPAWVEADRTRVAQVLSNLLQNAAKFTNSGGRVTVRVAADAGAGRAVVTVLDTGIGIAPEVLPRVFDTFTQADHSLARSRGGLGLGLALVKGIVELHRGGVQAASAGLGRGAEIGFWLPLGESLPAPPPASAVAGTPNAAASLRVLIVEDSRDAAQSLQTLLTWYGHQVTLAYTGREGVEAARRWRPDVVLCDLGLPELDGYEVAGVLRGDPTTAAARLIAVSGYGQEEDRRRSRAAGFDLHLTKPVDPGQLRQLLAEFAAGTPPSPNGP